MTTQAHAKHVGGWLNDLSVLTAGNTPLADSRAKVAGMAALLADDFPAGAFTRASLVAMASACSFWPTYAELCKHLGAWWRDHRPLETAQIANPSDAWEAKVSAEHAEAERDWSDPAVVRRAVRSLDGHPMRVNLGRMLASLVGRHAPQNVGFLPPEFHDETAQRMAAE